MTFSLTIGSYALPNFLELNLRSCRRIFGDIPILIYDGASKESERIKSIADRFGASFVSERVNRGHFLGDVQNAVCAVAFGQHVGATISCKINQRFLLLAEEIPSLLEEVFADPKVVLALPPKLREETVKDQKSKFHAKFPFMVDLLAFRSNAIDPTWIGDAYAKQVREGKTRDDGLTEAFWARQVETTFKDRWKPVPWLSEPSVPPMYLRKCQATEAMYNEQAIKLGMSASSFPCEEWGQLLGTGYQPLRV